MATLLRKKSGAAEEKNSSRLLAAGAGGGGATAKQGMQGRASRMHRSLSVVAAEPIVPRLSSANFWADFYGAYLLKT